MGDIQFGQDSTGKPLTIGSKVRWRGEVYTVKAFIPIKGRFGINQLVFEEPLHIEEVPDEVAVDLVE
jgi:hypothetical protein